MTEKLYRAFLLDPHGKVFQGEIVSAHDDVEAMEKLRKIVNRYGVELWDRARPVGRAGPYQPYLTGTTAQFEDDPLIAPKIWIGRNRRQRHPYSWGTPNHSAIEETSVSPEAEGSPAEPLADEYTVRVTED